MTNQNEPIQTKPDPKLQEFLQILNQLQKEHGYRLIPILVYKKDGILPNIEVRKVMATDEPPKEDYSNGAPAGKIDLN